MSHLDYRPFYRRHLPHVQPPGATLFVTFRLAGSIPPAALEELWAAQRSSDAVLARIRDPVQRTRRADYVARALFGKWDTVLDADNSGPQWLVKSQIAEVVVEALHHRDGRVYTLEAYCVMPNHVHLVCTPLPESQGKYYSMTRILHSLKRHTARQANERLGRTGQFWQHESYDHVVRDAGEYRRIVEYVLNNPVKAGLVQTPEEWPWSFVR